MSFPSEEKKKEKKKKKKKNLAYQVPGGQLFLKLIFLRLAILILEHI